MGKEKVIKQYPNSIVTGYRNENNKFVFHSFNDDVGIIYNDGTKVWYKDGKKHRGNKLPAIILENGSKFWYKNGKQYWLIENVNYFNIDEVYEKYKDKIVIIDETKLNYHMVNNYPDIIAIGYYFNSIQDYLILDDTDRNEVILRYG